MSTAYTSITGAVCRTTAICPLCGNKLCNFTKAHLGIMKKTQELKEITVSTFNGVAQPHTGSYTHTTVTS